MSKGVAISVAGWASASLQVVTGFGNATWVPSTDIMTALEASDELEAWLNDAARPWSGGISYTLSIREDRHPWLGLTLLATVGSTYNADAELRALLDWPVVQQGLLSIYTVTGIPSTVDCVTDVGDWTPRVVGPGGFARAGAFVVDSQVYSLRLPSIEALCDEAQAAALGEALAASSDPRTAQVWRHATQEWVSICLGRVDRSRAQMPIYRVTMEAVSCP